MTTKQTKLWVVLASFSENNFPVGVVIGIGSGPITALASVKGLSSWQSEMEKDCKENLIICPVAIDDEWELGQFVPLSDLRLTQGVK